MPVLQGKANPRFKHGMTDTPEFMSWRKMIERCTSPADSNYPNYGGRGITICARWREAFVNFYADMGPRPDGGSLDRIDPNGNYEPSNCRWLARSLQNRTRRDSLWVTFNGVRTHLEDAAKASGLDAKTVRNRIYLGWPEATWFQPIRRGSRTLSRDAIDAIRASKATNRVLASEHGVSMATITRVRNHPERYCL